MYAVISPNLSVLYTELQQRRVLHDGKYVLDAETQRMYFRSHNYQTFRPFFLHRAAIIFY